MRDGARSNSYILVLMPNLKEERKKKEFCENQKKDLGGSQFIQTNGQKNLGYVLTKVIIYVLLYLVSMVLVQMGTTVMTVNMF